MSLYLDGSALLAVLLAEPPSEHVRQIMLADDDWISARHTMVEVRRNLVRMLAGGDLDQALEIFARDWSRTTLVDLDATTCEAAAKVAEETGARTLDALHVAAALRVNGPGLRVLTLDRRHASAARMAGLTVADAGT